VLKLQLPGPDCVYWEQHKEWEKELDNRFTEASDPEAAKAGKAAAIKKLKAELDFSFVRDEITNELTGFKFMHDVSASFSISQACDILELTGVSQAGDFSA